MELPEFRRLLAETVAWCQRHASADDPAGSLRTPALRPTNLGTVPNKWGSYPYEWNTLTEEQGAVSALAERRAELLRAADAYPDSVPTNWAEGRLLIAAPEQSDVCGLSEPEAKGFIDWLDVPAWDTWLCWIEEPTQPDAEQVRKTRDRHRQERERAAFGRSCLSPFGETRRDFVDWEWQPPASVSYLLCWVPPSFLSLAEEGIRVNPTNCLFWAVDYKQEHYNTRLLQQLDSDGWLK